MTPNQPPNSTNIYFWHSIASKSLLFALLAGLTFAAAAQAQVNLLENGDFNNSAPGSWMTLTSGTATGLAHIITGTNGEDGTPYLEVGEVGGTSSGYGEMYQVVSAIPNATYTLSCDASVAAWWWPQGLLSLEYMDADHHELQFNRIDCAAAITNYDIGLPWKHFMLTALSPPGTAMVRIQFYCPGHGKMFFDNVRLTAFTPTILAVVQGSNAISLTWSPSPSAQSYNVKRSTIHGGPYATIATDITTTNYTDVAVVIGTTYYYVVSPVDGNEGSNSPEASALPASFLKANGCDLRDHAGTGQVVRLHGTNLGGWLYFEGWMSPAWYGVPFGQSAEMEDVLTNLISRFGVATKDALLDAYQSNWITGADLDLLQRAGVNVVRCGFHWSQFYEQAADPSVALTNLQWRSDADAFKHMDWLVNECSKRNIYVCFANFSVEGMSGTNSPGAVGDLYHNKNLYEIPAYQDRYIAVCQKVAAHYAGNPTVWGYDINSETPGDPNRNNVWNEAYQAIRSADPDHCVVVSTFSVTGLTDLMARYGWQNVVAEYHDYTGFNGGCTNGTVAVAPLLAERKLKPGPGVLLCPYYIGEFADYGPNSGPQTNGVPLILAYQNAGVNWSSWTLKTVNQLNWSMENAANNGASTDTDLPDMANDSAAEIHDKWTRWRTRKHPTAFWQTTMNWLAAPVCGNIVLPVTNGAAAFTAQTLLANVTDLAQYSQLAVTNLFLGRTAHGTLTTASNGYFYQADAGYTGTDSFTYSAIDQSDNLPAPSGGTVTLNVNVPTSK
jgi:hypothetical protein